MSKPSITSTAAQRSQSLLDAKAVLNALVMLSAGDTAQSALALAQLQSQARTVLEHYPDACALADMAERTVDGLSAIDSPLLDPMVLRSNCSKAG